jgi:hypothetical protein
MNSIEKSEDLYKNVLFILQKHDDKFLLGTNLKDLAKELAINTVDEIIESILEINNHVEIENDCMYYWQMIKMELQKL